MKLRPKVLSIGALALALMLALVAFGFPRLFARVSESQLFSLSRTLGAYLVHDLETLEFRGDEVAFEKAIDARFEFVQSLGESSGNFRVRTIILVGPDYKVEVGHPDAELGADYSSHADVREAMDAAANGKGGRGNLRTVIETLVGTGGSKEIDADIVAPLTLADGDSRVLEVKLDFTRTIALLQAQYGRIQLAALLLITAGLVATTAALLLGIRSAVIAPVLRISAAMEKVGKGDLDARAEVKSRDEFGSMAARFDEMTKALRERFQLQRYVSRSTVDAARERAERGGSDRPVQRKRMTVLFSDVRGFTSYSEGRDPARVVAVLNLLLGMQEEVVTSCGGSVDKFVADETMAVFDSPAAAVSAALAIRSRVEAMAGEIDGLELGFGIHSGELVEGDIGSPRLMDHTVIGDTVNTAARLQAAAKAGQIIVSAAAAADAGLRAGFELVPMEALRVKGKELPLEVYSVRAAKPA